MRINLKKTMSFGDTDHLMKKGQLQCQIKGQKDKKRKKKAN